MLRLVMAALVAAFSTPVSAQGLCGERETVVRQLADRYHETTRAIGLTANGRIVEVLTSDDGTWTIIVNNPDGRSCLLASGNNWQTVRTEQTGPGA